MKLRTKICLVCVAAMLILSQSFSLFILHLSQKDQLERISKYEYSIFENKVKSLRQYVEGSFDVLSTSGDMKQRIMKDGSKYYLGMEYGPGIESCVGGGLRYLALQGRDRCL